MSRPGRSGHADLGAGPAAPSETVEVVRDAVLAVPGVVGLHGGVFGEVGTYLPGRRVAGIRCSPTSVEIHLVVDETADVRAVASAVHVAALSCVDVPVHVVVDDLGAATPRRLS